VWAPGELHCRHRRGRCMGIYRRCSEGVQGGRLVCESSMARFGRHGAHAHASAARRGGRARSPQWYYENQQHADGSVSVAEPARGRWPRARTACKMEAGCKRPPLLMHACIAFDT
jgi:hypothetical protein